MKSVLVCGLLALALGVEVKDKLSVKAGDTMGDGTSTSAFQLLAGARLSSGQQLTSSDGKTTLIMQSDGNLVLYKNWNALWSSDTWGHSEAYALMQTNGNFAVYEGYTILWSSNTAGSRAYLQVQNDGNLVLYSSRNQVLWSRIYGLVRIPTTPGQLPSGWTLSSGLCLASPDGKTFLAMQFDGNLVVYKNTIALWSSDTWGHSRAYALMQTNGNFAVYGGTTVLWSRGSTGNIGAYLQVQNGGNLMIYSSTNQMLWTSLYGLIGKPTHQDKLLSGESLSSGECLASPDGKTFLAMQLGGNLAVYQNTIALWSSDTWDRSRAYALMQTNGNFAVYGGTTILWSSNTAVSGAYLQVQNDSNVVIYSSGNQVLWSRIYGLVTIPAFPGQLPSGTTLSSGACLASPDEKTFLAMQFDGNLAVYQNTIMLWSSDTLGYSGAYALMHTDGNFAVYLGTTVLWSSSTASSGAYLQVQNGGYLIIYSSENQMLWASVCGVMRNPTHQDKLLSGETLVSGECLASPDEKTFLAMQLDGNLVAYQNVNAFWSSGTSDSPGAFAIMQANGNFTVFQEYTVLWSSNTAGETGAYLQIQHDNVGIYISGQGHMIWSMIYGWPAITASPGQLLSGATLSSGTYLASTDGKTFLAMQADGNLILYQNVTVLWSTYTSGYPGAYALLQTNGNFSVFVETTVLWSSNTGGTIGAYLQVQNDTNLVVYSSENLMSWSWMYEVLANPETPNQLPSGVKLLSGKSLVSPNGQIRLTMQRDGNMILYQNVTVLWSTYTSGYPGAYALMQTTGNFSVFVGTTVLWSSNTGGSPGAYLQVENDSNLAIYSSGNLMLWSWVHGGLANPASPNLLPSGGMLLSGKSLVSPNGQIRLTMQNDGNMILYQNVFELWSSHTSGYPGAYAFMQTNGTFSVYEGTIVLWSSNTGGSGAYLQVENDYNLVIYSSGNLMLWSWVYGGFANPAAPNQLPSGGKLLSGMCLVSPNQQIRMTMQSDGNLVLYQKVTVLWSSGTSGRSGAYALMQTNGNFVVYGGTTVLFSSNTAGSGAYLQIQNDTNVVIYSSGNQILWSRIYGLVTIPTSPGKLPPSATLLAGTCLGSPDEKTFLAMQFDGNLVVYQNTTALWSSDTWGHSMAYALMQTNGNFAVYGGTTVLWSSSSTGNIGAYLQVQNDTNVVVYSSENQILWSSIYGFVTTATSPGKLAPGATLSSGKCLVSPDGKTFLAMQLDGNLVVYQNTTVLWSSGTSSYIGAYVVMNSYGNLVIYTGSYYLWSVNTAGSGVYLQVQNDTNVVVYNSENLTLWSRIYGLVWTKASSGQLLATEALFSGRCLASPDGKTFLSMQLDGNLVVYQNTTALWSSDTSGHAEAYALMQTKGNLIVFDGFTVLWSSNTTGQTGAYLQVQNDANVIVYSSEYLALWSWKYVLVANPAAPNQLPSGVKMLSGMYLVSPDEGLLLIMQIDGNLVFYRDTTVLWSSGTSGHSGAYALMQTNGNFVVYGGTTVLFSSNTAGSGAYLQIQNDTNVVIYSSGNQILWSRIYGLVTIPTSPGKLPPSATLLAGTCLASPDGKTFLAMQFDGNLVVYQNTTALWSSDTWGHSMAYALMQTNGNFSVYVGTTVLWSSNTAGSEAYLQIQNDANLVAYSSGNQVLWSRIYGLVTTATSPGKLLSGATLSSGACLASPDGKTFLAMQIDGNLVVYQNTTALWSSDTWGHSMAYALMQTNGNFVLYGEFTVRWSSNTAENIGAYLQVQNDTNVVVYLPGNQVLWSRIYGFVTTATSPDKLPSGATLSSGTCLTSPDRNIFLAMQLDGNLVIYQNTTVLWSSGTSGWTGASAIMEANGNFSVFVGTTVLWSINTAGSNAYLQVQNDNNVVAYSSGNQVLWSSIYGFVTNATSPGQLPANATLSSGTCLASPDGKTFLAMQLDGNLVVYQNVTVLWSSGTSGYPGASAIMQVNGNFDVYGGTSLLWSSNTAGQIGAYLQVQSDTNFVVFSSRNLMLWSWIYGLLANPAVPNQLPSGEKLLSGMYLVSPNGQIRLKMQSDGNLILSQNTTLLWSSGSTGCQGAYALMQTDGNFVVYCGIGVLWSSGTTGLTGAYLQGQDDTNFGIYNGEGQMLWSWKYGMMANPALPSRLPPNAALYAGTFLISPDGQTILAMQLDGNLIVYKNMTVLWSSGTSDHSGGYALMQTKGNLIVFDGFTVLWSSNTAGQTGAYLQVQNDTNIVVYNSVNQVLWSWIYGMVIYPPLPSRLSPVQALPPGTCLASPDGKTFLTMQFDGNLVVYQNVTVLWNSGTSGWTRASAVMRANGNFTVFGGTAVIWSSNTAGSGVYLQVQNDTNVVVYNSANQVLWSWMYGWPAITSSASKCVSNEMLYSGTFLVSLDRQIFLAMQLDGNLVLYQNATVLWSSGTSGHSGVYALMKMNGNFSVFDGTTALWSSNTARFGAYLQVQNDTNLVVYSSGNQVLWSRIYGLVTTATSPGQLHPSTTLLSGTCLASPDGKTFLVMQLDGNLVVYENVTVLWSTGTSGYPGTYAVMQANGNFDVWKGTTVLWSSGSSGNIGTYLQVQNDNNLVFYNSGKQALWSWKYGWAVAIASHYQLHFGETLLSGEYLVSQDGKTFLEMQADGNLVVHQNVTVLWSSGTSGYPGAYAAMQANGNFSVYGGTTVLWSSNTAGSGAYLEVQNDTNVVAYSSRNQVLWSRIYGLVTTPTSQGKLPSGATLSSGACLASPDGKTFLAMQLDGNLVVYQNVNVLWSSGTSGYPGAYAIMQANGNFDAYNGTTILFSSSTLGNLGAYLQIQNDANVLIYSTGNQVLWSWIYGWPAIAASPGQLPSGATLASGTFLASPDGKTFLAMQADGNLVVYQNATVLWSSGTSGHSGAYALTDINGNFSVYEGSTVLWSSNTTAPTGAYLQVQNDTNLVVYSSNNQVLWSWMYGLVMAQYQEREYS